MRILIQGMLMTCLITVSSYTFAGAETGGEIEQLRAELKLLRDQYEQRIVSLEERLNAAEARGPESKDTGFTDQPPQGSRSVGGNNAFNPSIGVIFQGQTWSYQRGPENYAIAGFPLGGEAGPLSEGLSLGETEVDISSNVDDLFTAWLTVPIVIEDGETAVEVEEAWIETLGLPAGLSLRMGRFFSDIGYLNAKHSHSWDFADQPLPYQAFLGNQYVDDGLQLRWVAPSELYFELAAEMLRGDRYPAAGSGHSGFGARSVHARFGGDAGFSNSWQAGLSYLATESIDRASGDEDGPLLFSGDSDVMMAEFVWKWAPNGNWKQKNFKLQAEYLWRNEDGRYALPDGRELPWDVDQQGWYLQAVYQARPAWRIGARYDTLSGDHPLSAFNDTPLARTGSNPSRYSLMSDWSHSEFSRVRLQYTHDEAGLTEDRQWGLQYIYSIGAHGAHSF